MPHLEITEVNYSEYDEIIVWFTDQKSRALEIEDRINLTMVVKQHIKIRYSIEPRDITKNICKSLSNKYGGKLLNNAKKSTTDAIKTASERAIQKVAEATGDLIGNKIADKITSVSKKSNDDDNNNSNNNNNNNNSNNNNEDVELTTHKKRCTSPEERQQIINELRLVPKKDSYF